MCNSHVTSCAINHHPWKKYWVCHWKEKVFCYEVWYFFKFSIQFLMNMIEWFSNTFIWAFESLVKKKKRKKSILHTSQNVALIRSEALFIVSTEYRLWILRNLCSNPSPATYVLFVTLANLASLSLSIYNCKMVKIILQSGKCWLNEAILSKAFITEAGTYKCPISNTCLVLLSPLL